MCGVKQAFNCCTCYRSILFQVFSRLTASGYCEPMASVYTLHVGTVHLHMHVFDYMGAL